MGSPEATPPPEPTRPSPVHKVARRGFRLYRALDKLDRAGGGGFGLSTLIKLAGWAGLLAILAALVMRLRTLEQQLDPVSHSVEQLEAELVQARSRVDDRAQASEQALAAVGEDAQELHRALRTARDGESKSAAALSQVRDREAALQTALQSSLDAAQATTVAQGNFTSGIDAQAGQLTSASAALGKDLDRAHGAASSAADSLARVQTEATALDGSLQALDVSRTRAALDDVANQAHALSQALQLSTSRLGELNALLQARIDEEKARSAHASKQHGSPSPEAAAGP